MSERDKYKDINTTLGEISCGSVKYVDAIAHVFKKLQGESAEELAKNMVMIGYAMGVIAGKLSDVGIEGYTLILNGIKASMAGEDRKEKMLFALWDKDGNLHSSEEVFRYKEGGKP